eukprot:scaffold20.g7797.t1
MAPVELTLTLQLKKPTVVPVAVDVPQSPVRHARMGVLLGHGASGGLHSGNMDGWASVVADAGLVCLRFEAHSPSFTHRVALAKARALGPRAPPSPRSSHRRTYNSLPQPRLQELLKSHLPALPGGCDRVEQWVFAGHSMASRTPRWRRRVGRPMPRSAPCPPRRRTPPPLQGARVACQLAADLPAVAAGLLLFSYPLHSPGKPEQLRDVPLADLDLPILFVCGTRDAFSSQQPWDALLPRLRSRRWRVHSIEGGNHSLGLSAANGGATATAAALEAAACDVTSFLRQLAAAGGAGAAEGAPPAGSAAAGAEAAPAEAREEGGPPVGAARRAATAPSQPAGKRPRRK